MLSCLNYLRGCRKHSIGKILNGKITSRGNWHERFHLVRVGLVVEPLLVAHKMRLIWG